MQDSHHFYQHSNLWKQQSANTDYHSSLTNLKNVHKFVIKNGLNYYSLDSLFTAPYGSTKIAHEILLSVKMYVF